MHLYMMTRGIKHAVDQFITELQGKYLPYRAHNKDGKIEDFMLQVSVRPIQLWEIVFPEQWKDLMLTTCLGGDESNKGETNQKKHKKYVWALRRILGVDEIPEYKSNQALPITRKDMEIVGVGIKEDYKIDGIERI